ncbi:MAG: glycoside hydrolase family 9 protein [Tannerella sp.]|jgi:hypothetical protein|nr:glycoside hydrolase family 9 protein [Tannerella sp.]
MRKKTTYPKATLAMTKVRCIRKEWLTGVFAVWMTCISMNMQAQRFSRDLNVDLLINQAGYVPDAGKTVIAKGLITRRFEIVNLKNQQVVFRGNFKPNTCDFGDYSTGDFSTLTQEGAYYILSDTLRSYPFRIAGNAYQSPMTLLVGYFSLQRCGASTTGYLSPCHLDDGIRLDNGKHQDVTGGWHDANDLRKWVSATIYGMIGLSKAYELRDEQDAGRQTILDELTWGNRYFLNMQEPQGYVMNYIGGEVKHNWDSNRWTDSEIGAEEGEIHSVKPSTGTSLRDILIAGSTDDRIIQTDPADLITQYLFVTSEAMMARITKTKDPAYSQKCLQAARKCFEWCRETEKDTNTGIIGASIQAAIEMYKTTGQDTYKQFSVARASQLKDLQVKNPEGGVGGFFYTSPAGREPYKDIWHGPWEFISVCDLLRTFPAHEEAASWKELITNYAHQYLLFMSQRNSFGIVPYGLSTSDPGGNRKVGNYWYRYFMHPEQSWWVGINANLASSGVGLIKAATLLNNRELKAAAQKQLDWIIGFNPFNSSTIAGVGYNHPVHFINEGQFRPATPVIPGGVMNGLGGDKDDQPHLILHNNYNQSEYWTPMVAYTLWLMAEISPKK